MRFAALATLSALGMTLAACGSGADQADEAGAGMEPAADAGASAGGGGALTALGVTEQEMLDADLVTSDGTELGEVEELRRDANGAVDGVLIELEGSNPPRYVMVPTPVLTTRRTGDDMDLQTLMSAEDLAAMPAGEPGAATPPA